MPPFPFVPTPMIVTVIPQRLALTYFKIIKHAVPCFSSGISPSVANACLHLLRGRCCSQKCGDAANLEKTDRMDPIPARLMADRRHLCRDRGGGGRAFDAVHRDRLAMTHVAVAPLAGNGAALVRLQLTGAGAVALHVAGEALFPPRRLP